MNVDRLKLRAQLELEEGERQAPYRDTKGLWSIGHGRNLVGVGLSAAECAAFGMPALVGVPLVQYLQQHPLSAAQIDLLLEHDIDRAIATLEQHCPWVARLDEVRQRVLIDLVFNMGWGDGKTAGLSTFHNTLAAFQLGNFQAAANGLQQSLWARQVGDGPGGIWDRAEKLIAMTRLGRDCPTRTGATT